MKEILAHDGDTIIVSDNFEYFYKGSNNFAINMARHKAAVEDEMEKDRAHADFAEKLKGFYMRNVKNPKNQKLKEIMDHV